MNSVPILTLNDKNKFPSLGLGTSRCKENQLYEAVKYAVKECGYRAIDSAFVSSSFFRN